MGRLSTATVAALMRLGGASALREADAAKSPSIDVTKVDDAVDAHLIAKMIGLSPHPTINAEEDNDLTEVLRSDLRVAIRKVLVDHKVRIVAPETPV